MTHMLTIYPEIGDIFNVMVNFTKELEILDLEEAAARFVEEYLKFVDHYEIQPL